MKTKNKKPIATINYPEMSFVWITDHYYVHLMGYCLYKNKLCYFEVTGDFFAKNPRDIFYNIYKLPFLEKIKALMYKYISEQREK